MFVLWQNDVRVDAPKLKHPPSDFSFCTDAGIRHGNRQHFDLTNF
ncbi:hypothetical protein [Pontibacter beigongshangensis]|nr:hypothetical protein [Pontibacter beigongshangensis]